MSKKTSKALQSLIDIAEGRQPDQWVRIGMDSGGIAAGAADLYEFFREEARRHRLPLAIVRTGSLGLAYLDPVVEVKLDGRPPVLYGEVDPAVAVRIVNEHLLEGKLVDEHILAGRRRSLRLSGQTRAIFVRDTDPDGEDHTGFLQSCFQDELESRNLDHDIQVLQAIDFGFYGKGMAVELYPSGVVYTGILSKDIGRIVEQSVAKGELLSDLHFSEPDPQRRLVLRNCGAIDPESLESAVLAGGYAALAKVIGAGDPARTIAGMEASGLRGRGGAGFPTGLKWRLTREAEGAEKVVICNADEGDPGAFMDRSVLEGDPHAVLEGLAIAGYSIGASRGYFYIRAEYPLAVSRVEKAIEQARSAGLLGANVLDSGWSFDVEVRLGAGAFVCGEETALIASVEGRRGSPNPRPPFPSVSGLWGLPTSINNVETLAVVPWIVNEGPESYGAIGEGKSLGTKVFAVTGKVRNSQLVEVPMGTPLRTIIYDICGGVQDGLPIKGVQTGGPSGGIIPAEYLDTPVTYENLAALGSIMGSGGMLVLNSADCMVDVAAFYLKFCVDESCGKCAPCRIGGFQLLQLVEKIGKGRGEASDIEQIHRICLSMQNASLCGLGQTAVNPILSALRYFQDEFDAYLEGGPRFARQRKKALAEGKELSLAS